MYGCTQEKIILIIKELLKRNDCLKHSEHQGALSFIPAIVMCMMIESVAAKLLKTTAIGFSPSCEIAKPYLEVSSSLKFTI